MSNMKLNVHSSLHLVKAPSFQSPPKSDKKKFEFRNQQEEPRESQKINQEPSMDSLAVKRKSPMDLIKRKTMAGEGNGKIGDPFGSPL